MAVADPTQGVEGQEIYGPEQGAPLSAALNVAGALASLALVAGIGIWGYKLMVRDVSGVPVVRALEGPMRVQPEDPGGREAAHQGLAVNAVAAQGIAEAPADRLTLAPNPVELADEDQPASVVSEPNAAVDDVKEGSVQSMVDRLIAEIMPDQARDENSVARAATQMAPMAAGSTAQDETTAVIPAVVKGPGPARSLRPQPRPARSGQPVAASPAVVRPVIEVEAASLPAGTRLAQLGAYDSAEIARQEWDQMAGRFGDYLEGKSRVIQKASSGGRIFYRLRVAGFDDLSDARRFCAVLVAGAADCIPVITR